MRRKQYHDVLLVPKLNKRRWRLRPGRYYPTGSRQLANGSMEVTFYLPPNVLRQWSSSLAQGRQIRLFVPKS